MQSIKAQQDALLLACGGINNGGSLREMLYWASGAADASSGLAQAALLQPAPADIWFTPAQWCATRTVRMRDNMCSECEKAPGRCAAQLLLPSGWETMVRAQLASMAAPAVGCDVFARWSFTLELH
jgi:hypothetical protein